MNSGDWRMMSGEVQNAAGGYTLRRDEKSVEVIDKERLVDGRCVGEAVSF